MSSGWRKVVTGEHTSIIDVIEVINSGGLKIALIVSEENQLLGTVTDGDIRRAFLSNCDLNTEVRHIMNISPIIGNEDFTRSSSIKIMRDNGLQHLPIVADDFQLIGLELLESQMEDKVCLENPILLMAGGFGKRLWPLTENRPKPLLKIGDKPILEHILKQCIEFGFVNFFISTHYLAHQIENYFGDGSKWGVSITYVNEEKALGTAGALGLLPKTITDLPILLINGDLLNQLDFRELLKFHNEGNYDATVCITKHEYQVPYGVVKITEDRIDKIVEKPTMPFFVSAGIYVFNPNVIIDMHGEEQIDMPDFLNERLSQSYKLGAFPVHEYWLDVGHKEEYHKANLDAEKYSAKSKSP